MESSSSAERRLARKEDRFVRLRSGGRPGRWLRPGEFSIPGIKAPLIAVVITIVAETAALGSPLFVLPAVFVVINLVGVAVLAWAFGARLGPPPAEPPYGNSGDRSPLVPRR